MIPRLLLALSFATLLAAQPADFGVRIAASSSGEVTVDVETRVPLADPEDITLRIGGDGLRLASLSAGAGMVCDTTPSVVCAIAPMPAGGKATLTMRFDEEPANRAPFVEAILAWRERGMTAVTTRYRRDLYRYLKEFAVTSGEDEGPGSLRQAILDANRDCYFFNSPCLVRFELGENPTLFPRKPLPMITNGTLVVEGPAAIDGSLMNRPANGIVIGNTSVVLRNLTVRGWPENGVEMIGSSLRVESSALTGNRSRGLVILGGEATVTDSTLSGNGRSGVFIDGGHASIQRSRIEDNGATGIFAARGSAFTTIRDSVIAGNAHFGVAFLSNYRDVDVARTRITGNRYGQIDIDLDGPSRFNAPAYPINGPTLHSATHDPATNTTTVRGRLDNAPFYFRLSYELHFYATTAANEADQYLGGIEIRQPEFTFNVKGDLRGRLITANTIRWLQDDLISRGTSELSAVPIEVH
jgi:hypothetical protein